LYPGFAHPADFQLRPLNGLLGGQYGKMKIERKRGLCIIMDRFDSPRQRFRWPLAILGAIFIVLGLWAFSRPGGAISGIVWAFALGILFKGVMDIAVWYDMGKAGVKRPTYVLLTGILDILFAILLFANSLLSTLFIGLFVRRVVPGGLDCLHCGGGFLRAPYV
jgi:uncharacterized membrane protein HdeD (DUF308 family)